ncbi:MAG: hypothetical protein B6I19_10600 [Bacteroidetes bacterium 4572_114]|nr:MAG: hypothetical protein B6I19_10600 [Bacteroidetes bacterium 4572_114]
MKELIKSDNNYQALITQISDTYRQGQRNATIAVNSHLVETYWKIGQDIVEFEQEGKQRAEYGKALPQNISKDLTIVHGKGFSLSNVKRMRQFYLEFQKGATLSHQLGWSHYVELLKIDDKLERGF